MSSVKSTGTAKISDGSDVLVKHSNQILIH